MLKTIFIFCLGFAQRRIAPATCMKFLKENEKFIDVKNAIASHVNKSNANDMLFVRLR